MATVVPVHALRRLLRWGVLLLAAGAAGGAEPAIRQFDLPADTAARSLKLFAQQSDVEVLIAGELAREVRTHAVKGGYTPREALERMFVRTGMRVKEDKKTGVMAILPERPADARTTPAGDASRTEPAKKKVPTP